MGIFKKILLGITLLFGLMQVARQASDYGFVAGAFIFAAFCLTTAFLWLWSSGDMPYIRTPAAIAVTVTSTVLIFGVMFISLASQLNVDVVEVIRASINQTPFFYVLALTGSALRVFFWRWLFAGVRAKKAAAELAA